MLESQAILTICYFPGQALRDKPSEYNARLNSSAHDWYREAAADYVAYTPLFIGSKLKEPILSAELDRARPNPDSGLGRAFLVTPDEFSPVMVANLSARNFCVLRGTLDELVIWLKSKIEKKVTPVDVALKVNAFARELSDNLDVTRADVDIARTVILHTWADTKRDADALEKSEKQKLGRSFLEGTAPTWIIGATDIPVWLKDTDRLYTEISESIFRRDRLFVVYGQSGSGKSTAIIQSILRTMNEHPDRPVYEIASDTPSLKSALGLIARLHRHEHVIIYIQDICVFADSMPEDLTSFANGQFTVI